MKRENDDTGCHQLATQGKPTSAKPYHSFCVHCFVAHGLIIQYQSNYRWETSRLRQCKRALLFSHSNLLKFARANNQFPFNYKTRMILFIVISTDNNYLFLGTNESIHLFLCKPERCLLSDNVFHAHLSKCDMPQRLYSRQATLGNNVFLCAMDICKGRKLFFPFYVDGTIDTQS